MECNKDEALRAKEVSEQKFSAKDIVGAKKFAEKAERLYPGLEGVSHMLETFDVYLAAEKKINGQTDWSAVLSVDASADIETIKKQFKKKALALHPDKNKSIGAGGAFTLLGEAFKALSAKAQRLNFVDRSKAGVSQHRASGSKRSGPPSDSNDPSKISKTSSSTGNGQNASTVRPPLRPPTSAPSSTRNGQNAITVRPPLRPPTSAPFSSNLRKPTFWTSCLKCRIKFEYESKFLNMKLLCARCSSAFVAKELPKSDSGSDFSKFIPQREKIIQNTHTKTGIDSLGNAACFLDPYSGTYCPSVRVPNFAGFPTASTLSGSVPSFTSSIRPNRNDDKAFFQNSEAVFSSTSDSFNPRERVRISEQLFKKKFGTDGRPYSGVDNIKHGSGLSHGVSFSNNELSAQEMRKILMYKSKKSLVQKINEIDEQKRKTYESSCGEDTNKHDKKQEDVLLEKEKSEDEKPASTNAIPDLAPEKEDDFRLMNVPDADFHDFDGDRVEESFKDKQIWAAYDDNDGMPRYYAFIHRVISTKPFQVEFSWLNSRSNSEFAPIKWVASGFPKSCGELRIGKREKYNSVNLFSHIVKWEKAGAIVKIYPRKGDVWALYKNWAPDWDENTADDIVQEYDMVEVLEGYTPEKGVLIAPLVKVAGFKALFCRHTDTKKEKWIPREEMFRFSHQVPSFEVSADQAPSAPKGCVELDPAAVNSGISEGDEGS